MPFRPEVELETRTYLQADDVAGAAAVLLRGYGDEIFGFLMARLPTMADAEDALQAWCEDVLRGLPAFRGDASLRTWAYRVARHRAAKLRRDDGRLNGRIVDGGTNAAKALAHEITTRTPWRDDANKSAMRALLMQLSDDDQEIIALHAGLTSTGGDKPERTFREIATLCADDVLSPADETREAARHRKRWERATARLRALWDEKRGS